MTDKFYIRQTVWVKDLHAYGKVKSIFGYGVSTYYVVEAVGERFVGKESAFETRTRTSTDIQDAEREAEAQCPPPAHEDEGRFIPNF